jgi:hypothetical protein
MELQQELNLANERLSRERGLEHRVDSLKKLLSDSEGELERMKYQYYKLFTKQFHIVPINSPTHLDVITEKDYRKIIHCESDAPVSLPRDENSYAYQKQEKLKRIIDEMNFSSYARERIIYKLTEACIEASKHTVKYMLLN